MVVLMAYQGMVKGLPWVVPSCDKISPPPVMNSQDGFLYVLIIYAEISGQVIQG